MDTLSFSLDLPLGLQTYWVAFLNGAQLLRLVGRRARPRLAVARGDLKAELRS